MEFFSANIYNILLLVYILLNFFVFCMYAVDKYKAIHHLWRISERTLLIGAWFGIFGAILGMLMMRHKIRKPKFQIIVPLILIVQVVAAFIFMQVCL